MLLEAGLLLILIPWSSFWERNYFGEAMPWLHDVMTNGFVRGAVSGLGVLNLAAAVGELVDMFRGPIGSGGRGESHLNDPPRLNDGHA